MDEAKYAAFTGTVVGMDYVRENGYIGCTQIIRLRSEEGQEADFIINPQTYFLDGVKIHMGDQMTAFYSSQAPAILIYPPQYYAVAMAEANSYPMIKLDYFDEELLSADKMLSLQVSEYTEVILKNNQDFAGNIRERDLLVVYSATTRSIPAQTTPIKVVVFCS